MGFDLWLMMEVTPRLIGTLWSHQYRNSTDYATEVMFPFYKTEYLFGEGQGKILSYKNDNPYKCLKSQHKTHNDPSFLSYG